MELTRVHDRVAIVGFCKPDRDWVPYGEPDLEVWGLNRGNIFMPAEQCHKWFEMHGKWIWDWELRRPGNHVRFLKSFHGPIIMHERFPEIPNSVAYPFLAVAADVGAGATRFSETNPTVATLADAPYLSSTVAQEIALAIHMGYSEISLFGIDLNTTSEYAWQKPAVEHYLGVAIGRGIKVRLPEKCPLLAGKIYGRGYKKPEGEQVSPEQWAERINALKAEFEETSTALHQTVGMKKELEWVMAQMVPGIDHEAMDQRRHQFERAIAQVGAKLHQINGSINETLYWAHQTPAGQDASQMIAELAKERLHSNGFTPAEGPEGIEEELLDVTSGQVPMLAGAVN